MPENTANSNAAVAFELMKYTLNPEQVAMKAKPSAKEILLHYSRCLHIVNGNSPQRAEQIATS